MKLNKTQSLVILFSLILVMFLGIFPSRAEAYNNPISTLKIGLRYGDDALVAANLENHKGAGYTFGFYDSDREYHSVGGTDQTRITMLKDWSLYLSGNTYYDEEPNSYTDVVGCYHIRLNVEYFTFQDAAVAAAQYTKAFPSYFYGKWYVCVGSYVSYGDAEAANFELGLSGEPMTASSYCVAVVATGTSNILFKFDCGSEASLAVMPKATGDEKPQTWFKGYRYLGGFQYTRINGENLTVVNYVDLEDYVKGVIGYEMDNSWPVEALKAQAMCARTYAVSRIGHHKSYGFDLCSTTCCQVYGGQNKESANIEQAVDSTAGLYILYDNQLCQTFYHSSDGGATENSENVFVEVLPYIRGVIDPHEQSVRTGYSSWSFTYTAQQITALLQSKNYSCGNIISITPTYTALGNIYSLKFTDDRGKNYTFSKGNAGSILYSSALGKYTYSQRFTLLAEGASETAVYINGPQNPVTDTGEMYAIGSGEVVEHLGGVAQITVMTGEGTQTVELSGSGLAQSGDAYVVSGSGWGHNVGMSQYGAKAMAILGYSYEDIVKFYFTGVTIG